MKKRGCSFSLAHRHLLLRGTCTPSYAHSAVLRVEGFLISFVVAEAGAEAGFLGMKDFKRDQIKHQSIDVEGFQIEYHTDRIDRQSPALVELMASLIVFSQSSDSDPGIFGDSGGVWLKW